ncbi:TPA: hypothetical protein U1V26_001951 [Streptococcus suis]|nr:hypothetical protein [Streptococcus suis]HEM3946209.1 hypothetical protein [Streptococcus suis]
MITLTKLKEKANLLEIDVSMLSLMPMYGMKEKSKEVRVVCKKLQRSISEKNWVDCIVLLGEIEEFERYYRNWLIDRGEEEDDEVLEKMHEYIVDLEIGIEKRLREGEEECREERVELVRYKNPSFKDSLKQKFSMNEEI